MKKDGGKYISRNLQCLQWCFWINQDYFSFTTHSTFLYGATVCNLESKNRENNKKRKRLIGLNMRRSGWSRVEGFKWKERGETLPDNYHRKERDRDGQIDEGRQEDGTRYLSMRDISCRQALAVSSSDIWVASRVSCSSTSLFSLSISLFTVCRRFLNSGNSFSWSWTIDCLKWETKYTLSGE